MRTRTEYMIETAAKIALILVLLNFLAACGTVRIPLDVRGGMFDRPQTNLQTQVPLYAPRPYVAPAALQNELKPTIGECITMSAKSGLGADQIMEKCIKNAS